MTEQTGRQDGYIALVTVLVLGAASLAIGLGLLLTGTDSQRSGLVAQQTVQARNLANACAEEGLQQIRDYNPYTGTSSLTFPSGNCTVTVANTGSTTRTVTSRSTVNDVVWKASVSVTIGSSSISVTSWQEVP